MSEAAPVTESQQARDYLRSRGLTDELVIGAARLEFDGRRIRFPWIDAQGGVVYNTGRSVNGAHPKYLHTKGERPALYATPGAWQASRVAVVEGQMDALAALQAGTAAFATSGPALSDEAIAILRAKDEVVIATDADDAGERIKEKLLKALAGGPRLEVVEYPEGFKDLADVAAGSDDPGEAVARLLAAAVPIELERPFDVLTARAMCDLPEPDAYAEVCGPAFVRGQRAVIGAHTGHGKTTLLMELVRAVTEESGFLGWKGSGGRALIIDAEQGLRTIKRRLREAKLDSSDAVDYLRVPDGLSLDSDEVERGAIEEIIADGGYSIVGPDPLYKLHSGDSNAEREAVDLMRVFDRWREQYQFCLVLPVHCRKPPMGAKFSMHEFFGSSAYLRGAEVVLGLQLIRAGYSRLHFFKDRDGDLPVGDAWGLLFDREQGYVRDPEDGKGKVTAAEKVRALLEIDPGLTIEELVKATECAERTVKKALKDLGAEARSGPHNVKAWRLPLGDE